MQAGSRQNLNLTSGRSGLQGGLIPHPARVGTEVRNHSKRRRKKPMDHNAALDDMALEELLEARERPQTIHDRLAIEELLADMQNEPQNAESTEVHEAVPGADAKKADLVAAAEAQGLDTSGTKADLAERLASAATAVPAPAADEQFVDLTAEDNGEPV